MMPSSPEKTGNSNESPSIFIRKLWNIVNDDLNEHIIQWSDDGEKFIIFDQQKFSEEILPKYFKHNNMSSFIRQLNLYQFHKIASIHSGSLATEWKQIEFSHPNFIQGNPELLKNIKRKVYLVPGTQTARRTKTVEQILEEVENLRKNQEELKNENQLLWKECDNVHKRCSAQQETIGRLFRFLVSLVQQRPSTSTVTPVTHKMLALPEHASLVISDSEKDPNFYQSSFANEQDSLVIHEVVDSNETGSNKLEKVVHRKQMSPIKVIKLSSKTVPNVTAIPKTNFSVGIKREPTFQTSPLQNMPLSPALGIEDFLNSSQPIIESPPPHSAYDASNVETETDSYQYGFTEIGEHNTNKAKFTEDDIESQPELLQAVNISEVNPNVIYLPEITNSNSDQNITTFNNRNENIHYVPQVTWNSGNNGQSQGKNDLSYGESNQLYEENFHQSQGKVRTNLQPNASLVSGKSLDNSNADMNQNIYQNNLRLGKSGKFSKGLGKGKRLSVMENQVNRLGALSPRSSGKVLSFNSNNNNNNKRVSEYNERPASERQALAVPHSSSINPQNLQVDDLQTSIDSLKDILTGNSNLNIDASTILSLFDNVEDLNFGGVESFLNKENSGLYPNMNEMVPSGNEVTLYQPSISNVAYNNCSESAEKQGTSKYTQNKQARIENKELDYDSQNNQALLENKRLKYNHSENQISAAGESGSYPNEIFNDGFEDSNDELNNSNLLLFDDPTQESLSNSGGNRQKLKLELNTGVYCDDLQTPQPFINE